jgi:oxygen-independent coproporphyrinogen-3 oxidase
MSGIYIHIPFCTQACTYCDFHFTTSYRYKDDLLKGIEKELELRKNFLLQPAIHTVYFGGGTPGSVELDKLQRIIDLISRLFELSEDAEITIEINPDNVNKDWISHLKKTSFNRLSIGIQSFDDTHLKWMNRSHSSKQADYAVKALQDKGYENINVDLIYGFDQLSHEVWEQNLNKVAEYEIPHLSAYSLTVEPQTPLAKKVQSGLYTLPDNHHAALQFEFLMQWAELSGFEQYEISNFARNQTYSKHNSAYWNGIPYLGLGPSAHSFDGKNRYHSISNNLKYLDYLSKNQIPVQPEESHAYSLFNDLVFTGLRTKFGVDLDKLKSLFLNEKDHEIFLRNLNKHMEMGNIRLNENRLTLSLKGKLRADAIASDLFLLPSS